MAGSNGTRMAGEKISQAEANRRARVKKSNNPEDAKRRADRARSNQEFDFGDLSDYSDKEISMALRGEQFSDEDYGRLTGKEWGADDAGGGGPTPPADPVVDSQPGTTTPDVAETPNPTSGIVDQSIDTPYQYGRYGGMTQNVNQDNDINSTVTGSNNVVNNNQDNSINGYAGDSQRFSNDYIKRFTEKFGA